MKIVLVNLPWKRKGLWGVRAGSRWPHIKSALEKDYSPFPFFMAYAGSLLKREGFEVEVIDSLAQQLPLGRLLKLLNDSQPDLLVAETSTPSLANDLAILQKLPQGLAVALCGPEINIRDGQFLARHPRITYAFVGEYEYTLLELAQRLKARQDLAGLCGLIYMNNGVCQTNPARPLREDLDDLPWPLRDGLPMEKYKDTPGGIPSPSVQMWSSRGCPYHCLFCSWPQLMYQSHRYRTRNVIDIVDEMEYLVTVKGFKSVYFDDDTMNIGKLRMMVLANEIKRRDLNVPWAMMARADLMEEDVLENLRAAGLTAVKYGVESGNQTLVDRSNKKLDLQKLERMVRFTKSLGIKTHLTFTFGLPGETQATIQQTIDFAKELDPDSLQFSITTAFPGTQYFNELETCGHIVSKDLKDYDGSSRAMLRTDSLSAGDLRRAKQLADKAWQMHVWRTRPQARTTEGLLGRSIRNIKDYGFQSFLSRGSLFLRHRFRMPKFERINKFLSFDWRITLARPLGQWEKIKKNVLNLMGVQHGSYAFKGPDCVQIDLTSNCNNNCVSCWCNSPLLQARAYKGVKKYKTLPTQLVLSLIDDLIEMGTGELYFSGGGEPFMHPDIMTIMAHAKARGAYCCINTNFTLVNEEVLKQIIDLKVDALTVSFWAANAASYVRTHPNKDEATFYRMTSMLKMLNALKDAGKPEVKIYNVISNLNYTELEEMVAFAEDSGSEAVEFTVVDTIPGATDQLMLDQEQRQVVLAQCNRILSGNYKVQVLNMENFMRRLSDASAHEAQYDSGLFKDFTCLVGWVFSRIMPDGDVNFCLKAHRMPVGNLYKQSFREIWNSAKQREFRLKAVMFDKEDAFFRSIGNDENCKMGCYKSCDDIGRNMVIKERLNLLSPMQKAGLRMIARLIAKKTSDF